MKSFRRNSRRESRQTMPSASLETITLGISFAILLVLIAIVNIFFRGKKSASSAGGKKKETKEELVQRKIDSAPNGPLYLYFGSQTGTAEAYAKQIYQEGKKKGFGCKIIDLDGFDPEQFKKCKRAIFFMATYGEGDPTDNAVDFMNWLKNPDGELSNDELKSMQYMVFGLGSTQYEHFNRTSELTDKHLEKLGAQRLMDLVKGDDNQSLDDDFEGWRENMWKTLLSSGGVKDMAQKQDGPELPQLNYRVEFLNNKSTPTKERVFKEDEINASTKHFFPNHYHTLITKVNNELRNTKRDDGSTKHIEYDLSATPDLKYTTADNLAILPENDTGKVKALANVLNYDLAEVFVLKDCEKHPFPTPSTIGDVLRRYYDISGIPRRATLKSLALFAKDAHDRDRLMFLASKEGKEDFNSFILNDCRSVFDLITESFPSVKIPFEYFLHVIPPLQPRYYTISSSSLADPRTMSITVSLTKEKTRIGKLHLGVASNYLCNDGNQKGFQYRGFVRPSTFRLPQDTNSPIIMVGPGTGIAPMRAFLQEIRHLRKSGAKTGGEVILFFGCKTREQDYIYQDELESYLKDGTLTQLHTAFSREQEKKIYVQDILKKDNISSHMWELLGRDAHVYVCGSTRMGHDVKATFTEIAKNMGQVNDAPAYIKNLEPNKRYVQELW